jgi:hypothetical protein
VCLFAGFLLACGDTQDSNGDDDSLDIPLRFELQSVGFLADSLFPGPAVIARFQRTRTGEIFVGPFYRGATALARVGADLQTIEPAVRRGFGPGEATGMFVYALSPDDGLILAARELGRSQVLSRDVTVRFGAPTLRQPDGVGMCGGRVVMTGSSLADGALASGVYAADSGAQQVTLLHALETDSARRIVGAVENLLSIRRDRIVAAIPNRPEVVVSDSGCRQFKRVVIPLAWFQPWTGRNAGGPEVRPNVIDLHWHNDSVALLHIVRANPDAGIKKGSGPTDAPTASVANVPLFLSDLVAFDVETGRVLAYLNGRYMPYKFTSDGEVAVHHFGDIDATELLTLRLVANAKLK